MFYKKANFKQKSKTRLRDKNPFEADSVLTSNSTWIKGHVKLGLA